MTSSPHFSSPTLQPKEGGLQELQRTLYALANPEKARILQRYFKTGKGEYGEGDKFLGIVVPTLRKVAQAFAPLPLKDIERLLHHPRHEMRMCALLLLLVQTKKCPVSDEIIKLYLRNTAYINNWDLVDLSAPALVGRYYFDKGENADLCSLANSSLLRERRIAIIATFYFIRHGQHTLTFSLAKMLLHDPEELIHKAVGRMLREVGKRIDEQLLLSFLERYALQMPRVMLRYAIERLSDEKRKRYLGRRGFF